MDHLKREREQGNTQQRKRAKKTERSDRKNRDELEVIKQKPLYLASPLV